MGENDSLDSPAIVRRHVGRIAVVTGGANGIGAAIVERLCKEGCHRVFVADIDVNSGGAELAQAPCIIHQRKVDVSSEGEVMQFAAFVSQLSGGHVDVLVNNAATFVFESAEEVTEAGLDKAYAVNIKGTALVTKHISKLMKTDARGGAIVNISSISSQIAQPGFVPYSMTKAAIAQMTRNTALDLGQYNIRVNAVNPGPILTDGTRRQAASEGRTLEEMTAVLTSGMVLKKMGKPEDVAAAVAFLASDEASFITGTALVVDGGYTIQ